MKTETSESPTEMDAHLSNGRINISQLKDELKRKLVDFFSKYEGNKVGV